MRIMIVDDSPVARLLIAGMLEPAGHQIVAEAENMEQALKAYQTHKPDAVTLDLTLAQESGLTILKELLQLDKKAKVVVVSANSQQRTKNELMAAGAFGYVTKPFTIEDLETAIKDPRAP